LGNRLIDPPLGPIGKWYAYRLLVEGDRLTVSVDDRKIYDETLPQGCDPWLSLCSDDHYASAMRNLRITGNPTIPEELDLCKNPGLAWLPEYYDDSDQPTWQFDRQIIRGARRTDAPGSNEESLLQYHHPLIEDGEIEYEFYYEPDIKITHPAMGRLAFLLEPEGVRIHWLTAGKYDRTELAHDNAATEPDCRRGQGPLPWKPDAWNRLKLDLHGDLVKLWLNDTLIYPRTREGDNDRFFGLFHYTDRTESAVRNVRHRGDWPRTLPKNEDLFIKE
jgi:hypothetical protein